MIIDFNDIGKLDWKNTWENNCHVPVKTGTELARVRHIFITCGDSVIRRMSLNISSTFSLVSSVLNFGIRLTGIEFI
jgi:hypothetical protein